LNYYLPEYRIFRIFICVDGKDLLPLHLFDLSHGINLSPALTVAVMA